MPAFVQQHPVLVFGLVIAFSLVSSVARGFLGLLFGKPVRKQGRAAVAYVQKHGYQLLNPILAEKLDESLLAMAKDPALRDLERASSDITDIEEFADGNDDWLGFRCTLGSRAVTIFNFSKVPPLQTESGGPTYRVAKIAVDGLPRFSLEPRSVVTVVETLTDKLRQQPDQTIELASASFNSRYRLRGTDPGAVAAFFTVDRIRFIETERLSGTFATNARYLVYYESVVMRTESDYEAFVGTVERIATRFL